MDLLIATHALNEDCTLISADRTFMQVPGLRVFDWSASSVSAAVRDPAQYVRDKLAHAGVTPGDVEDAIAHARAPGHVILKTKPEKKLRKKTKAK